MEKKKTTAKKLKKTTQQLPLDASAEAAEASAKPTEKNWCALLGFKLSDHDEVGCLAFRSLDELRANPKIGLYKIVDDISEAKWFPCENYDGLSGFASPEKWLEFFSSEPSLKDWKFHLVRRTSKTTE